MTSTDPHGDAHNLYILYVGVIDLVWKILAAVLLVSIAVGVVVERAVTGIQTCTIADVRSGAFGGGSVAVVGTIVDADSNRFILSDDTGRAELSTCPLWYKVVNLHTGDKVTVVGEVINTTTMNRDCDLILSVYKVFTDDGVIVIRGRPGKPPWFNSPAPSQPPSNY